MNSVRVWDLPLRIFHWLLATAVAAAAVTGQIGGNLMTWHGRIGVLIAGLIGFRLAWGFVGSTHARFTSFVRGPAAIAAYLRGQWNGVGHNPLGALSVLGLLGIVGLQTALGLFGNDDIAFQGPLYALVSKETSDRFTALHHRAVWLVALLVGLHLAAIAFYTRVRKEDLVGPMLTGVRAIKPGEHAAAPSGGGVMALLFALAIGTGCAWAASGGWLPPAPPAAIEPAPAW